MAYGYPNLNPVESGIVRANSTHTNFKLLSLRMPSSNNHKNFVTSPFANSFHLAGRLLFLEFGNHVGLACLIKFKLEISIVRIQCSQNAWRNTSIMCAQNQQDFCADFVIFLFLFWKLTCDFSRFLEVNLKELFLVCQLCAPTSSSWHTFILRGNYACVEGRMCLVYCGWARDLMIQDGAVRHTHWRKAFYKRTVENIRTHWT